jgi:hypothetical protein
MEINKKIILSFNIQYGENGGNEKNICAIGVGAIGVNNVIYRRKLQMYYRTKVY